jgi:CrcB protein
MELPDNRPQGLMAPTATGALRPLAVGAQHTRRRRVFCCPRSEINEGNAMEFLLVFISGGIGSALRHGVNVLSLRLLGVQFQYPVGTFCINLLGSFLMGLVVEYWVIKSGMSHQVRLFLTTGLIGGFTTFSTFALEIGLLNSRGEAVTAMLYAIGSVAVGVGSLYAGMALVRALST